MGRYRPNWVLLPTWKCCGSVRIAWPGKIPAPLGNLSNLTYLDPHRNRLDGTIPWELDNLAKLEVLWPSENRLSGEISARLGNLTHLDLNGNQLDGEIPAQLRDAVQGITETVDTIGDGGGDLGGAIDVLAYLFSFFLACP